MTIPLSADPTPTSPTDTIQQALASALAAKGYSQLTPVQLAMTNEAHGEADLLVSAQTGSGKTVAFGIAIASTLLGDAERFDAAAAPLGLVIAPTRELAIQVQRELEWLYAQAEIRIATCVGGMDMRTERRALDRGAHDVLHCGFQVDELALRINTQLQHQHRAEMIRNNLLPVTAAERLLRHLGLPDDSTAITEMRLVVELLMRGAIDAAAAMLDTHLDASMKRMIAQMKIVSIIPGPSETADYLTRVE